MMDISATRQRPAEQTRIRSLIELMPKKERSALLDVGTRDGHLAIQLSETFQRVIALDLTPPKINHRSILPVQGNITALGFPDNTFDVVLCAEVLEHLTPSTLQQACAELTRVVKNFVVIGVPYKQDLRVGRTTCTTCHKTNPPYGHVNSFDEDALKRLFPHLLCEKISFVGQNTARTNFLSAFLLNMAGNPYGTYAQEETCLHCGARLQAPPQQSMWGKILTKIAFLLDRVQSHRVTPHANWIHILFKKPTAQPVTPQETAAEQLTPSATPALARP